MSDFIYNYKTNSPIAVDSLQRQTLNFTLQNSYCHRQIPAALSQTKTILLSSPALQEKTKRLRDSSFSSGIAGNMQ